MPIYRGTQKVTPMRGSVKPSKVYRGNNLVWVAISTVKITGTSGYTSRDQFRQACIDHGTTYDTVEVLPFALDVSGATNIQHLFNGCVALTSVPPLNTSNVTTMTFIFRNCTSLTPGSVSLVGRYPGVIVSSYSSGTSLPAIPPFENIFEASIPRTTMSNKLWTTVVSHTIASGTAAQQRTFHFQATWGNSSDTKGARVLLNGTVVGLYAPTVTGNSSVSVVVSCSSGDIVQFQCYADSTTTGNRVLWESSYCGIYTR